MAKLTDEEMTVAFRYWYQSYRLSFDENCLKPFLNQNVQALNLDQNKQHGWLRKVRKGLFLSASAVAENLKITRAAYSNFEKNEEDGSITLATLAKAAEAMDCELVYALRPKNRKYFSQHIWQRLLPSALVHPWVKKCDPRKRGQALAAVATRSMDDAKFRKQQGWSQRANAR